jgi:hypothetical protein
MTYDQIQCKHCSTYSVFRHSMRDLPSANQSTPKMGTYPVAVSCPECKHVYMYESHETTTTLAPVFSGESESRPKRPSISLVHIVCGRAECKDGLEVTAARAAGVTLDNILDTELKNWTLHDLECPNGHPILRATAFWPLSGRG